MTRCSQRDTTVLWYSLRSFRRNSLLFLPSSSGITGLYCNHLFSSVPYKNLWDASNSSIFMFRSTAVQRSLWNASLSFFVVKGVWSLHASLFWSKWFQGGEKISIEFIVDHSLSPWMTHVLLWRVLSFVRWVVYSSDGLKLACRCSSVLADISILMMLMCIYKEVSGQILKVQRIKQGSFPILR